MRSTSPGTVTSRSRDNNPPLTVQSLTGVDVARLSGYHKGWCRRAYVFAVHFANLTPDIV